MYAIRYAYAMRTTSFTNLRKRLAHTLDSLHDDREPVIITREGGKPSAVLMSMADFASYEATFHLMRSPANAMRLAKSIAELGAGRGKARILKT